MYPSTAYIYISNTHYIFYKVDLFFINLFFLICYSTPSVRYWFFLIWKILKWYRLETDSSWFQLSIRFCDSLGIGAVCRIRIYCAALDKLALQREDWTLVAYVSCYATWWHEYGVIFYLSKCCHSETLMAGRVAD